MEEFTARGAPLTNDGLTEALNKLGAAAAALWAVLSVETSGCGYLPDRRPKILFERHRFHKLTNGRFDAIDPDVSAPTPGGYGPSGAHQYVRLHAAMQLDREAALKSASWGLGQIMGENHKAAGFDSVQKMVDAFVEGEDQQLKGMAAFIAGSPMKSALKDRDWQTFARLYNGPNYAANQYDGHLKLFCGQYESRGCPEVDVRQAQVWLTYLGYDTGGIDGIVGRRTTAALRSFQEKNNIPPGDGSLNAETLAALAKC